MTFGKQEKYIGLSHKLDSIIPNKQSWNLLCLLSPTQTITDVFNPNLVASFKLELNQNVRIYVCPDVFQSRTLIIIEMNCIPQLRKLLLLQFLLYNQKQIRKFLSVYKQKSVLEFSSFVNPFQNKNFFIIATTSNILSFRPRFS